MRSRLKKLPSRLEGTGSIWDIIGDGILGSMRGRLGKGTMVRLLQGEARCCFFMGGDDGMGSGGGMGGSGMTGRRWNSQGMAGAASGGRVVGSLGREEARSGSVVKLFCARTGRTDISRGQTHFLARGIKTLDHFRSFLWSNGLKCFWGFFAKI